ESAGATTAAEGETEGETEEGAAAPEAESPGTSRRRRRRRRSGPHTSAAEETEDDHATSGAWPVSAPPSGGLGSVTAPLATPETERETPNGFEPDYPYEPFEQPYAPYAPYTRGARERTPQAPTWEIGAGQQQIGQPRSPFTSPEPSFARGFG